MGRAVPPTRRGLETMQLLKPVLVPINRAGWPFIAVFAAVTLILFGLWAPLGWLGVVLTAWCVYFFRDPDRVTPIRDGLIVSPADGVILPIVAAALPPPELDMEGGLRTRISVFMNVFDVHVNRSPCPGTVTNVAYTPGKFFNASLDKASEHNERMSLRIRPDNTAGGDQDIGVVQIAGLVARRIKTYMRNGQSVSAGERIGLIRFGSRVDIYLPVGVNPIVTGGQRAIAGETVLADMRAQEPPRPGEIR